jgi:hypothetical protein
MEKHRMHYETLLKVTQAISMSKDSHHHGYQRAQ